MNSEMLELKHILRRQVFAIAGAALLLVLVLGGWLFPPNSPEP